MPSITITVSAAIWSRIQAVLPPDYTPDADGAKELIKDCVKERIRAHEQSILNAAAQATAGTPDEVVIT